MPEACRGFFGRTVLVTGATSGIGRETARLLSNAGAGVIAVGRNSERLAGLARELGDGGLALQADVEKPTDIARLMAHVAAGGRQLEGLVVNAGVSEAPSLERLDLVAYERLMDINVKGAVFTCVHALPLLADGASIVFVGSVAGRKGQPGDALYAGSKGFIRAFARNLGTSPDMMARKIRVNVVSPGPIETPLTAAATSDPEVRRYVEAMIPLGRWGQPDEVAEAIAFLLSPASRFTTGAELTVDGGMAHV